VFKVLRAAGRQKPIGAHLLKEHAQSDHSLCQRDMNAIGG
jgi:hypothetical protein